MKGQPIKTVDGGKSEEDEKSQQTWAIQFLDWVLDAMVVLQPKKK